MLHRLALLALFPFLLCAQYRYSATTGDVSLSGAATQMTIQQPATNGRSLSLESATVYCSVACTVTQSQNGTAATATAGTTVAIAPNTTPAVATVWTASNVGSGTAVGGTIHLTSSGTVSLDLSKVSLGTFGTKSNYTVWVSSITGTANITFVWSEK